MQQAATPLASAAGGPLIRRATPLQMLRRWPWLVNGLAAFGMLAAYYAAARVALLLAFAHSNVTPVWPPSGIAVGILVLAGIRWWPVFLVGAYLVNLTTGLNPLVSTGLALGNTLEYAAAALLLERVHFNVHLRSIRDVMVFALAALVSPVVAATIGTASLWAGGVIPSAATATVWPVYLVGDGAGILLVTPLLLAWCRGGLTGSLPRSAVVEILALGTSVVGCSYEVFLGTIGRPYLIFPFAIWAAIRFGHRAATAVVLVVSSFAVWGTAHGVGPFHDGTATQRLADLQVYLAAFALTALSLAAVIGELRDTEAEVLKRTKQLEVTNGELEAFAYTVAHDLRAPLRAIDGFAKALVEDYADGLPGDMRRHLDRITVNAVQMGRLIDALLDFARLGPQRLNRQNVEPKRIVDAALEQLLSGIGERTVDVSVGPLPGCSADPALLALVYQNLLDNALKFTQKKADARILVGCAAGDGPGAPPVYFVQDNGAGFDMKYADKLFGVFARLHRQAEFPGTGAGLAIVRRIVTKHGGDIWAHAEKGNGATFFFTLDERR